jgi:hypothetical protein
MKPFRFGVNDDRSKEPNGEAEEDGARVPVMDVRRATRDQAGENAASQFAGSVGSPFTADISRVASFGLFGRDGRSREALAN